MPSARAPDCACMAPLRLSGAVHTNGLHVPSHVLACAGSGAHGDAVLASTDSLVGHRWRGRVFHTAWREKHIECNNDKQVDGFLHGDAGGRVLGDRGFFFWQIKMEREQERKNAGSRPTAAGVQASMAMRVATEPL